jgi:hypothetical protein
MVYHMDRHLKTSTVSVRLPKEDVQALRDASRLSGVPINTLLMPAVMDRVDAARSWLRIQAVKDEQG